MKKRLLLLLVVFGLLFACENLSYYHQAAMGQYEILSAREDIATLVERGDGDVKLLDRLALVLEARAFAADKLLLPVNGVYSAYSHLDREFAVWNVYAAPALSLEPYEWCFPVTGCVAYKGYFDEADAIAESATLKGAGYDSFVGGVKAYSTLGWFDDPVLSTFIDYDEPRLLELLFHELAHGLLFVKGDTRFNESFATAVAALALSQWYEEKGNTGELLGYQNEKRIKDEVFALVLSYKDQFENLYDSDLPGGQKQKEKALLLLALKDTYAEKKAQGAWGDRFDGWINSMNNARLATLGNYHDYVPAFIQIYHDAGGDWSAFYTHVQWLSELDKADREQALRGSE